jgi:DNA adenine methylase
MKKLRLIKYPGSKWVSIPDIKNIWKESGCDTFVDVFGGSGSVSLNIESKLTVYNEIDKELFNLFLNIRDNYLLFNKNVEQWTSSRKALNDFKHYETSEILPVQERQCLDAFRTFYKYNTSFGGAGETYTTYKEKSTYTGIIKTIALLPRVKESILNWKLENLRYEDLLKKYDQENTFFYMDPPYPGKEWYKINFSNQDFINLSKRRKTLKGKYLLNFDRENVKIPKIFGDPQFVKKYENKNGNEQTLENPFKYVSFYTNVLRK